jgi:hypothetical protein
MPARDLAELERWLETDEAGSRPYRTARLQRLLALFDTPRENVMFMGGSGSFQAYTEMRLAFIHGLYFSTVVLALSCIEQELAGALYASGSDVAARAPLERLVVQAREAGILDEELFLAIEKLRGVRNAYAHFRPPLHPTGKVMRALDQKIHMDDLSESDAIMALEVMAAYLCR